MKRQSKAEETLNKQIENLRTQMEICQSQINDMETKRKTLWEICQQLESESHRLYTVREKASAVRKP